MEEITCTSDTSDNRQKTRSETDPLLGSRVSTEENNDTNPGARSTSGRRRTHFTTSTISTTSTTDSVLGGTTSSHLAFSEKSWKIIKPLLNLPPPQAGVNLRTEGATHMYTFKPPGPSDRRALLTTSFQLPFGMPVDTVGIPTAAIRPTSSLSWYQQYGVGSVSS